MRQTGKVFTPEEYKLQKFCLRCGIAGQATLCELCAPYLRCEVCTIVLKPLEYYFWKYEIREKKNGAVWVEFTYLRKNPFPPVSETLCSGCVDYKKNKKDICYVCNEKFTIPDYIDEDRHYKNNGNMCYDCSLRQ